MQKVIVALSFTSLIVAAQAGVFVLAQNDVRKIPTLPGSEELRSAMHVKLSVTQDILKGLVLRDFDLIEKAAATLKTVSLTEPPEIEGGPVDNQLYQHFKLEFLRLTTHVEEMAREKNHEGVAFAYHNLTANCMACHSYLSGE